MKEQKYLCKVCGQLIKPTPAGTCPLCGAPREMLVMQRDRDDEENDLKK